MQSEAKAARKRHPGLNASEESCSFSEIDGTLSEAEDGCISLEGTSSLDSSFADCKVDMA